MRKKLMLMGSILSVITIPVITISCSTTWTKWKKDDNPIQTTTKFSEFKFAKDDKKWKVRAYTQYLSLAFNKKTNTIDLEKINNQFELNFILAHILGLISQKSADEYWDDFEGMKTFLEQLTKKIDLHFKYKHKTTTIAWDIDNLVEKAIQGINEFKTLNTDKEKNEARKSDAISKKGIDDSGTPNDFGKVAFAAGSLTSNKAVISLLNQDANFALKLSKLVNLPNKTFDAFVTLMSVIDEFMNKVYKTSYKEYNHKTSKEERVNSPTGELIKEWFSKDEKDLSYNVSSFNGAFNEWSSSYSNDWTERMKGQFIIGALKRKANGKNK